MKKETLYQQAVKEYGPEMVTKMCQRAVDPVTGYIARNMNCVHLLDGKTPCRRCGGVGLWEPGGAKEQGIVLCLRCQDDWHKSDLLEKHGYVWGHKKWMAAFNEFCQTKPKEIDVKAHNQDIVAEDRAIRALLPEYFG